MPWSADDWEAWRAENRRLLDAGWALTSVFTADGSVKEYADKDNVRIDRTPQYERGA